MGKFDAPDLQVDGQMDIEELFEPASSLFAVSRIFARARKNMSLGELKALAHVLKHIRFKDSPQKNSDTVYVGLYELAGKIGVNSDREHLRSDVFRVIRDMRIHSNIDIADKDRKYFDSGAFIRRVTISGDKVRFVFEKDYLRLFMGLEKDFLTFWADDISKMSSKRSVQFYEFLRQITDGSKTEYEVLLGVRKLKEMFDIPKDGPHSYMRKNGGFDRTNFEKSVIIPICEDLEKCDMIRLLVEGEEVADGEEGKKIKKVYYKKEKVGRKVIGYRFHWAYAQYPKVAPVEKVKEINDMIIKDPVTLKIAGDIAKGKKNKKSKNAFNQFEQNTYDFDELEKDILSGSAADVDEYVESNTHEEKGQGPIKETLPPYYIVVGHPDVEERLKIYGSAGIPVGQIKILSQEMYDRLK